jgi:hypothetical protein
MNQKSFVTQKPKCMLAAAAAAYRERTTQKYTYLRGEL